MTVSIKNLVHTYQNGSVSTQVLKDINLEIGRGEVAVLTGPSGCGKTTLLTLIGALRAVQEGQCNVLDVDLAKADRKARQVFRRQCGFIFQAHNLIECLNAEENVQMGCDILEDLTFDERREEARKWLRLVGLGERLTNMPSDLSGGQKQRVAIARALAAHPKLLLADEPTAALDKQSGREVVDMLKKLANEQGCTVLMVTHDQRVLDVADRLIHMEDGRLV